MSQGVLFFDRRFMPRYVGSIVRDPAVAIVELVANAWDAYATKVEIVWPDRSSGQTFSIRDNGQGMTEAEFERRWCTLDYNRLEDQGDRVSPPEDEPTCAPRPTYGRNGRGRHAAFFFSDPYEVTTWRNGERLTYRMSMGTTVPIERELVSRATGVDGHGTEIRALSADGVNMSAERAREVIGERFLLDPSFKVYVDGTEVTFNDIPTEHLRDTTVEIPGLGTARVVMIDTQKADKTTRQHGVAWRVMNRLVGEPGWKGTDYERILDGRSTSAKRFNFIVFADFLASSVEPDWTDFRQDDDAWKQTQPIVQDHIRGLLRQFTRELKADAKDAVKSRYVHEIDELSIEAKSRWHLFVDYVIETCPSITVEEVKQLAGILANLEKASSKYSLIGKLHSLHAGELDDLHKLLDDWSLRTAILALDEIQTRLKLISELDVKLRDANSAEVQDLQPLFERGLWIFGPQFESIEYTSNKGMTEVMRKLFGSKGAKGTLNRPDFAVLPDSSLGLYSRDSYGADSEVNGVASLVIVEIKKPTVPISTEEKAQPWKYVRELINGGYITKSTDVRCFVLGKTVDPTEAYEATHMDGRVRIEPMSYEVFIKRAEKRMLNLRAKLSGAPFLKDIEATAVVVEPKQLRLIGTAGE